MRATYPICILLGLGYRHASMHLQKDAWVRCKGEHQEGESSIHGGMHIKGRYIAIACA